jgi:hypothetical protein
VIDPDLRASLEECLDDHIRAGLDAQLAEVEALRSSVHADFSSAPAGTTIVIGGRTLSIAEAHRECDRHFDDERLRITAGWERQREINLRKALAYAEQVAARNTVDHTMYDRSLSAKPPAGAVGKYSLDGQERGHSTQYYADGTRVSWETDAEGDFGLHWTDQKVRRGRKHRHTPPPHSKS